MSVWWFVNGLVCVHASVHKKEVETNHAQCSYEAMKVLYTLLPGSPFCPLYAHTRKKSKECVNVNGGVTFRFVGSG